MKDVGKDLMPNYAKATLDQILGLRNKKDVRKDLMPNYAKATLDQILGLRYERCRKRCDAKLR